MNITISVRSKFAYYALNAVKPLLKIGGISYGAYAATEEKKSFFSEAVKLLPKNMEESKLAKGITGGAIGAFMASRLPTCIIATAALNITEKKEIRLTPTTTLNWKEKE